ncbi:hypothetical protein C8F04DRAFT_1271027 [Mycena alexandri]|uniref:Uncharacterized protein n=1 Tax=Mycena alexandri TaxID=1745969 RepID=A0AAD6WUE2_9AGAR|nr:hypothetical protein C8F04DRAFT_1271027 [Mycena alexandri]
MCHSHAKSYIVTVGLKKHAKTFDVLRQDDNTIKCPWQKEDGSECNATHTNSELLRKHLKKDHNVKPQIRIESIEVPQLPTDSDSDSDYSDDGEEDPDADDYSDDGKDPLRALGLRSSGIPLEDDSVSGATTPLVDSAIPQMEVSIETRSVPATHAPFRGNAVYHEAGAQVARDLVGPHRQQRDIRPSPYSRPSTSTIHFKSLRAMQESPQKGRLENVPASQQQTFPIGRSRLPSSVAPQTTPAPVAAHQTTSASSVAISVEIPDNSFPASSRPIERLSAVDTIPPLLPVATPAPGEHNEGFSLSSPMANAGGNFYAAPSSPGPVPEVASPFANDDFAYDWGHFQDAPSATPQFTAATSSVTENFARVPNPTPPVANLLVVPNAPSLIARDDNTGNSGDIADAPNLSPRIVNLVADTPFLVAGDDSAGNSGDIADESNSSLRVADLANPPSLIARDDTTGNSGDIGDASNPGARVAGDGGPAVYNSFESEADGSGVENAAVGPCPCGEGMFTRPHIVDKHEKSHTVKYHDGAKPIKATLYRKEEVGFKFLCICGAEFALKAEVDAHAHEIEIGKHRGHGQSYAPRYLTAPPRAPPPSPSPLRPQSLPRHPSDRSSARTPFVRLTPPYLALHCTAHSSRATCCRQTPMIDFKLQDAPTHDGAYSPSSASATAPSSVRPDVTARTLMSTLSLSIPPSARGPAAVGHGRCASFDAFAACTSIHATRAFSGIALHRMLRASFRDAPLGFVPCVHSGAAAALATMQDTRISYRSRRVEQLARGVAALLLTLPLLFHLS